MASERVSGPDVCGCHERCTVLKHVCEKTCVWPLCMSEEEMQELLRELAED